METKRLPRLWAGALAALLVVGCGDDATGPTGPNGSSAISGGGSGAIDPGCQPAVEGIAGSITTGSSATEAILRWQKTVDPDDLDRVVIEVASSRTALLSELCIQPEK